ncbi:Clavaminate synthase-like protein [Hypoxylon sp. FL1150]|nr:Clavaminate synthase-like protein [Hypoxylon sp. FL1150]
MIPTLDLSHFTSGSEEQRQKFVQELLASFDTSGFVKLINHGFDEKQLNELFTWSKTFFNQPIDAKLEIPNETGPRPMRGYTGLSIEYVSKLSSDEKIRIMSDTKEHFDQGPAFDTEYPNKWPSTPSLSGFRPFMEAFYLQCDEVCITLVKALEVAFGVEDGSLVERCIPAATDLRLTHYPPITVGEMKSGKTSRIAPHSDFGIVTLLFQDSTGGLEVEDRSQPGTFAPVPPTDTMEMIVNVGDTLERWTNGKLFGGIHRVAIPEPMLKDGADAVLPERYSMAYLHKAQRNTPVGPLPKFVTPENPAKYPEMTALEFQKWRNNILYTY